MEPSRQVERMLEEEVARLHAERDAAQRTAETFQQVADGVEEVLRRVRAEEAPPAARRGRPVPPIQGSDGRSGRRRRRNLGPRKSRTERREELLGLLRGADRPVSLIDLAVRMETSPTTVLRVVKELEAAEIPVTMEKRLSGGKMQPHLSLPLSLPVGTP